MRNNGAWVRYIVMDSTRPSPSSPLPSGTCIRDGLANRSSTSRDGGRGGGGLDPSLTLQYKPSVDLVLDHSSSNREGTRRG